MEIWLDDLFQLMTEQSPSKNDIRKCLEDAATYLEFEVFSLGYQQALPLTSPRLRWMNNYPKRWQETYLHSGYVGVDPRIDRARASSKAFAWTKQLFDHAPDLWHEMENHRVSCGCTQSVLDGPGGISMLSLVRSRGSVTASELNDKRDELNRLAQISHRMFARLLRDEFASRLPELTERELEVMRWTADGKSAQDIADILSLSKNTVDFHIKNSVHKLGAPNKTAAVTQAALLGLLR